MNRSGIVIDGDDTLWDTMRIYTSAKERFFKLMEATGFQRENVEPRFEEIDRGNVNKLGFSRHRFPQSLIETYHEFCTQYGAEVDARTEAILKRIGHSVFKRPARVFEQAKHVLITLKQNHVLILATKGDESVQLTRIETSGLKSVFDRIYILAHKSEREFETIVSESQLATETTWSVGDSLRSDIYPAIAVGLKAIWIPRKTWSYETVPLVQSPRLFLCETLNQVPDIVFRGEE